MSRRWLINLGLALTVAAAALVVFFRPGLEPPAAPPPLTALAAATIVRIEIERPGRETIVLERAGADWRLSRPRAARANRFRIENLLRLAGAGSEWRQSAAGEDLARYGLDRPQAILRLDAEEIRFGGMHPLKSQQYLLYRDQIHLVSASHFASAAIAPEDFLSTALLEDGAELEALTLPGLMLERGENGWRLKPENKDITTDRLQRLADEWRHARALAVAPYGDKPVKERLALRLAPGHDRKPRTLDIGILERRPELILYRADERLEYRFPAEAAERLLQLPAE